MDAIAMWCGYLGASLLVAGPSWQAVVELRREVIEASPQGAPRIHTAVWLIPWLPYLLVRRGLAKTVSASRVFSIATGWAIVALGAMLVAAKEAWELAELYGWPTWTVPVLVAVAVESSTLNIMLRAAHLRKEMSPHETAAPGSGARG